MGNWFQLPLYTNTLVKMIFEMSTFSGDGVKGIWNCKNWLQLPFYMDNPLKMNNFMLTRVVVGMICLTLMN